MSQNPTKDRSSQKTPIQLFMKRLLNQRYLFLMTIPFVIWILIFAYLPLWGWIFAFQNYKPGIGIFNQDWVGLKYFVELFNTTKFYEVLWNTIIMSGLTIVLGGFLLPITFALFLNEIRNLPFKRTLQTISYLPHFVSWVIVAGIFMSFLSVESGIINNLLVKFGLLSEPINFLGEPKYFYAISTISEIWKELGWNAIIFFAAISGVDPELYEASTVDGAGRYRKMWHITLPGIRPTIIVLFIISVAGIVNAGFEKQFLFWNALNGEKSEVLGLYALQQGLNIQRYGFGTAIGIFTSVISVTILLLANAIFKKTTKESIL